MRPQFGAKDIREHHNRTIGTYFHPVGTVRMGAVVDAELRVHGINATVLAIAERAAEIVLGGGR
ncbi:GMC oxidoreductase [Kibdelosporangium philippinense]|uniref:GMC oxidoreductase n=1 Tax=Kibdelosporangium philippinense TaxID=211113 RepID=UPI0024C2489D|nr:GMC oxidoreductase [Kibdelosporangium philippinense]